MRQSSAFDTTGSMMCKTTKRWIGMKYLAKVADAEEAWQQKASRIRAGKEKSMLTILEERGLVQRTTGYAEHHSLSKV